MKKKKNKQNKQLVITASFYTCLSPKQLKVKLTLNSEQKVKEEDEKEKPPKTQNKTKEMLLQIVQQLDE